MNLASCDGCGLVLDKDKVTFPDVDDNPSDFGFESDVEMRIWSGCEYVMCVPCPCCGKPVPEKEL